MALLGRIFDTTFEGLSKSLDLHWRRNQVITSNIANAETPGYRAVDLNFGDEVKRAFERNNTGEMKRTNGRHLDLSTQGSAHLVEDLSGATRPDGNNVDLDIQMGQLTYNGGKYSMAATVLRKQLSLLRQAIREGSR